MKPRMIYALGDVYDIVHRVEGGKSLTHVYPGQSLGFRLDDNGELLALRHVTSPLTSAIYRRTRTGYDVEIVAREPEVHRSFHVHYEELHLDGDQDRDGNILVAEFINQGKSYTAYRYIHETGDAGCNALAGVSMRKAFLMAPVDFTRISSHFNPRRLHPIYKTRRPHRGADYAAPRGTPVFSSGEGRVIAAGYSSSNGECTPSEISRLVAATVNEGGI